MKGHSMNRLFVRNMDAEGLISARPGAWPQAQPINVPHASKIMRHAPLPPAFKYLLTASVRPCTWSFS